MYIKFRIICARVIQVCQYLQRVASLPCSLGAVIFLLPFFKSAPTLGKICGILFFQKTVADKLIPTSFFVTTLAQLWPTPIPLVVKNCITSYPSYTGILSLKADLSSSLTSRNTHAHKYIIQLLAWPDNYTPCSTHGSTWDIIILTPWVSPWRVLWFYLFFLYFYKCLMETTFSY